MKSLLLVTALIVLLVSPASAASVNLTGYGSSGEINDAIFFQYSSVFSSGTGVFDTFLRVQHKGTEKGYNTDGPLEYDTKCGIHTRALMLGEVPTVFLPGSDYAYYREFLLDINENNKDSLLTLDALELYVEPLPDITDYASNPFTNLIYDLDLGADNWVVLDAGLNPGSGKSDMLLYVPSYLFGTDESSYVYLYSQFGLVESSCGGFEEWGTRTRSLDNDTNGDLPVPLPATVWLLAPALMGLAATRQRVSSDSALK